MQRIYKKLLYIRENNKVYYICIGMLFLLFSLRIFNLDCDLPPFGISYYQSIDEGLYSKMAINLYKYDSLLNTADFSLYTAPNYRANIIGNILQYISLKILGNNYYGFRIAYVIIAMLALFLIIKTVEEITKQYGISVKNSRFFILSIMIFVIADFSYLMMSRTVENSNIRVAILILSIYIFVKANTKYRYFLLSFIGILSIFLVYYSHIVTIATASVLVLNSLFRKNWEHSKKIIIQYLLGILLGIIIAELYYLLVWNTGAFSNLFKAIFDFSDRINTVQSAGLLKKLVKGVFLFLNSNMFFYSFAFLFLSIVSIIFNIGYAIKKNDEIYLLINVIIILGFVQSVLTQDWMERKAIVFYPALIINIILFIINISKNRLVVNIKQSTKKICYTLFCIALLINIYTMFRLHINYSYFYDFGKADILIVLISIAFQFVCIVIFVYKYIFKKNYNGKLYYCIIMLSVVVINLFFSFKYVYLNDSYVSKKTMKEIGNIVGQDYIAGPYAYGFSLYNDCKMISNKNLQVKQLVDEGYVEYVLDYSTGPYYANQILPEDMRELIYESPHSVKAFGWYNYIGLYKKID
ncbi:glycosyltransferase family protein [Luxibacter massiliensis]|uniref:hypothetical protein n=1 Tax=Luxibacter massiliensis TaxID=2219695 RepID=UPI000F053546|nr:hypothetical protein [Luxibacter massiliensis]